MIGIARFTTVSAIERFENRLFNITIYAKLNDVFHKSQSRQSEAPIHNGFVSMSILRERRLSASLISKMSVAAGF